MKPIKKFFELSSIDRKGVIILIGIIIIIFCIQAYLNIHIPKKESENLLIKTDSELIIQQSQKAKKPFHFAKPSYSEVKLFNFDPNTVTASDMRKLGMNNKIIKSLTNYRLKGGRFYKEDDIKKIYGFSDTLYNVFRPYIIISKINNNEQNYSAGKTESISQYNINNVDTTELKKVNGIGSVLATRIIKYRNLLGGFYNIDQLKEVYGLTDEKISIIKKNYFADTAQIVKININQATEFDLRRHPYLGKFAAKSLVNYRHKVVKIRSLNEIFINGILPRNDFEKLKKYLTI